MTKRIVIEVNDDIDEGDIKEFLYHGSQPSQRVWVGEPYVIQEENAFVNGNIRMTTKQRDALWNLCGRYNVPFREDDYHIVSSSVGYRYVEGWIGGREHNGNWGEAKSTIFVGVSPDGVVNS